MCEIKGFSMVKVIAWFEEVSKEDVNIAGGKGANLGEMTRVGIPVPPGFMVTAPTYKEFIKGELADKIKALLNIDVDDAKLLEENAKKAQKMIMDKKMPPEFADAIKKAYEEFCKREGKQIWVACRSSATAEDLPGASFAGEQATYLNVKGADKVVEYVQKCWASLFTARAIFYRVKHDFPHEKVYMSVVVQKMVESEVAGVMFTVHPTTSEKNRIVIEGTWGLGESVVSGEVTPDRFVVDKDNFRIVEKDVWHDKRIMKVKGPEGETVDAKVPKEKWGKQSLSDDKVVELAKLGKQIEDHYQFPQDIEWAYESGKMYIVQSRAVTAFYGIEAKEKAKAEEIVLRGLGASPGVGIGPVKVVLEIKDIDQVKEGDILVTKMTNPDWVPAMRKAKAVVTDDGGMTCHAAIVSREMGTPCIVGTKEATKVLSKLVGQVITVDGTHGLVFKGERKMEKPKPTVGEAAPAVIPQTTATNIYVNLSIPDIAQKVATETGADGVGLLRAEHMMIELGKHPRKMIEEGGEQEMVNRFADGIRKVAEAFYPKQVVYRFLDFKPDEFLGLDGGEIEKKLGHVGPNPLIGFRGCFRYTKEPDIFRLECRAIRKVREEYKLNNVYCMLPFVRRVEEFRQAKKIMEDEGLVRGLDFKLWIMVEVPNTVMLIDKFIEEGFDGVSFGTNDLTMLILGIDRDDASVAEIYDERNLGVLRAIGHVIDQCNKHGLTTSICGQAPSNYPEYLEFMVRHGATSVSVNPDVVVKTRGLVAHIERKMLLEESIRREKKQAWQI